MALRRNLRLLVCLCLGLFASAVAFAQENQPVWRCGWSDWPPYQFETTEGEVIVLTGLDVQIMRAIAREAGREVTFERIGWPQHQEALRKGELDVAAAATWTPERAETYLFSDSYRNEENALYVRAADLRHYSFSAPGQLLDAVRAGRFRLGVLRGFAYALPEVCDFILDPANASKIVFAPNDGENLIALAEGRIDGLLVDRLVAASLLVNSDLAHQVAEYPLPFGSTAIHAMFSRATMTEADVAAFNQALGRLKANRKFDEVLLHYLLPSLLNVTVGAYWLELIGLIGIVAFAISGVLLAQKERYNLTGAFILAALPAVGGGLLRDLMVDRNPVTVLRSPVYLLLVAAVVLAGFAIFKLMDHWQFSRSARLSRTLDLLFKISDTLGLAILTVIGVRVAVETQCEPLWLWGPLLAAVTGAGGGILRDIVRADYHNNTLKQGFYAEIPFVWGLIYSVFLEWEVRRLNMMEIFYGTLFVLAGVFATRLLVVLGGWRNPFRFGSRHTLPSRKIARLEAAARHRTGSLPDWFEEREGYTEFKPIALLERRHLGGIDQVDAALLQLQGLMREPLPEGLTERVFQLTHRFSNLRAIETALYELADFCANHAIEKVSLKQSLLESIGVLVAELAPLQKGAAEEYALFLSMTESGGSACESLRARIVAESAGMPEEDLRIAMQFMAKFEHLVRLLHQHATILAQPLPENSTE